GTGLTLSTTLVFSQPTVRQLAAYLGAEMGLGLGGVRAEGEPTEHDRPEPSNGAAEAELDDLLRQVETLSPEALDELLQGRDDGSWADPRAESGEAPETRTRPRTPGVVR
ncbi:MAG: acyl carrier protein, partial [Acidobacteriota bacterium]